MVFAEDDQGVYCYKHPKSGWLTCEDSCRECGRRIDDCECDKLDFDLYEADTSEEEIADLDQVAYQVRVNGGDGGHLGGEMECIDDCFRAITDYHYKNEDFNTLTITRTPKLDEDRCEFFGVPYEIEVVYTITKMEAAEKAADELIAGWEEELKKNNYFGMSAAQIKRIKQSHSRWV